MSQLTTTEIMAIKQMTLEEVVKYKDTIASFIYESIIMSSFEESYTKDQAVEKVRELCEYVKSDRAIVLGAFINDSMIGFLWAYPYPFREDINRLYVSILHVLKEYRNLHIQKKLIACIEKIAKDKGFKKLFLHAEATNKQACSFYENNNFIKERIQFAKKIDYSKKIGGVHEAQPATILRFKEQFITLYYENVKAHVYEEEYSITEAESKIDELHDYLMNKKAWLFYTMSGNIVTAFMWIHPINYKGINRIYIHAFGTNPQFGGKGHASLLYKYLLGYSFNEKEIYTHVDASNHVSRHIQEKFGFKPELIQYTKRLLG